MSLARLPTAASLPRWARPAREAALAAGACVLDLIAFSYLGTPQPHAPAMIIVGYAAAGFAVLPWRLRAPYLVFGILWVHSVAANLSGMGYFPTLGLVLMLYTIAAHRGAAPACYALLACLVPAAMEVAEMVRTSGGSWRVMITASVQQVVFGAAACAAGLLVQASRRLGRVETREAVAAEQLRIARELHDIVAHSVTVILLQAAGARTLLRRQPERAARALAEIEDTGKRAMEELRRLLTVLRGTDPPPASREPQPGLADLDRLLDRAREAGLRVELRPCGRPRRLDAGVDLTAYRVVQEALTNVFKHAAPDARATVELTWADDRLTVRVVDDGPRRARAGAMPAGGYGLAGLRERTALVGGRLTAVHTTSGGFAVTATLPLERAGAP